jgi:hypothetical protein
LIKVREGRVSWSILHRFGLFNEMQAIRKIGIAAVAKKLG